MSRDTELPQLEPLTAPSPVTDSAGLVASIACAVHCAAMPLVIGYLPMLGLSWLADPAFHRVMAIVCFALALSAFLPGWRRHGSLGPALFGAVGVGLLSVAAFGLEGECCPSCASAAAAQPEPACTAACCVEAAAEASDADEADETEAIAAKQTDPQPTETEPTSDAGFASLATVTPLITPAGGVFLVAGHWSNRRRLCACCGSDCQRTE